MKFENKTLTLNGVPTTFVPFEITSNGSYVWKEDGVRSFKALRLVITPNPSRDGLVLDRVNISIHKPHITLCEEGCGPVEKVEYSELITITGKFHPETSDQDDRVVSLDVATTILGDSDFKGLFLRGDVITR